jgi:hypothetical protein
MNNEPAALPADPRSPDSDSDRSAPDGSRPDEQPDRDEPAADDVDPPSIRSVITAAGRPLPLGRVTDPRKLDASGGQRARLRVVVTREWLAGGAELEVLVPRLLACDRCQGGGCDSCERSGALRAPRAPEDRLVKLRLPSEDTAPCVVRLVEPFAGSAIAQLLVRIEVGNVPSPRVRRVLLSPPASTVSSRTAIALGALVLLLFALATLLLLR